jgi:hypothetical protein
MKCLRIFAILLLAALGSCAGTATAQERRWRVTVGAQMPSPNPNPVDPFPPAKPEK